MNEDPLIELEINRAAQSTIGILPENRSVLNTGAVTGLREDGTVNVEVGGALILKVPCATTYQSRTVGDTVQILLSGTRSLILCKVGSDPSFQAPEHGYTKRQLYTSGGMVTTGLYQQSCSGEGADTSPRISAWTYWNGSANELINNSAGASAIRLYVARSADDALPGTLDKVPVIIQPHSYDIFPASGFVPDSIYGSVSVSLQCGEGAFITLPNSWKTAIQSGNIQGFCSLTSDLRVGVNYAVFSDAAGSYSID